MFTGGVGGLMGLCLGVSLISITEFLEFIIHLCIAKLSSKQKPITVKPSNDSTVKHF